MVDLPRLVDHLVDLPRLVDHLVDLNHGEVLGPNVLAVVPDMCHMMLMMHVMSCDIVSCDVDDAWHIKTWCKKL